MADTKASDELAADALADDDGFAGVQDGDDVFILMSQVKEYLRTPIVTVSATSHNLGASDVGAYLRMTSGSAKTVTFRPDATFDPGDASEGTVRAVGAGTLTLTPGMGVTLNLPDGGSFDMTDGMTIGWKKVDADEYDLFGQTVPA